VGYSIAFADPDFLSSGPEPGSIDGRKDLVMRLRLGDLNESIKLKGLTVNSMVCGDMVLAHLRRSIAHPIPHLAQGLPDDVCRAHHWGYVLTGSVNLEYLDGTTERVTAGEAFFSAPGHVYTYDEDAEIIEFSPLAEMIPNAQNMERVLAEFDDT
jgi:hypothetical protein